MYVLLPDAPPLKDFPVMPSPRETTDSGLDPKVLVSMLYSND